MKQTFLSLFFFGLCLIVSSQNPLVKQWDKRYGGIGQDKFVQFQQTTDCGYILGGLSSSDSSGDKTQPSWGIYDYWIVKIDSVGNKEWNKRYGGVGTDILTSVLQTTDGGYILGGYSNSGISGDKTQATWGASIDYWIVKVDSLGIKQWDKKYGGNGDDALYSLQQTQDGGYILGGISSSGISGDKTEANRDATNSTDDYWLVKIDSLGIKQWDKRFGSIESEFFTCLIITPDGGYIAGGYTHGGISDDKTQANWGAGSDYWIVKIDSLGNKQWDARYGGDSHDELSFIKQTPDIGYILAGHSRSGISGDKTQPTNGILDYWLVKIDSVGNKEWDKDFGASNNEELFNLVKTKDGGFLISGDSYSNAGGDKSENNLGKEQFWIIKTDSLCNKQWEKTVFTLGHDENGISLQSRDGGYVVGGCTNVGIGGEKTQATWDTTANNTINTPIYDYWIIKFLDTTTITNISPFPSNEESLVTLFPNPASSQLFIKTNGEEINQVNIYNMLGERIMAVQSSTFNLQFSIAALPTGVYIAEVKTKDASVKKMWVKE